MDSVLNNLIDALETTYYETSIKMSPSLSILTPTQIHGLSNDKRLEAFAELIKDTPDFNLALFNAEEVDWIKNLETSLSAVKKHVKQYFKPRVNLQLSQYDLAWLASYRQENEELSVDKKYPKTFTDWYSLFDSVSRKLQEWDGAPYFEPGDYAKLSFGQTLRKVEDYFKESPLDEEQYIEWLVESPLLDSAFIWSYQNGYMKYSELLEALDGFYLSAIKEVHSLDKQTLSRQTKKLITKYVDTRHKLVSLAVELAESDIPLLPSEAVYILKNNQKSKKDPETQKLVEDYEELWSTIEEEALYAETDSFEEVLNEVTFSQIRNIYEQLKASNTLFSILYYKDTPWRLQTLSKSIKNFLKLKSEWKNFDKLSLLYILMPDLIHSCLGIETEESVAFKPIIEKFPLFRFLIVINPKSYQFSLETMSMDSTSIKRSYEAIRAELARKSLDAGYAKFFDDVSSDSFVKRILKYRVKSSKTSNRLSCFWKSNLLGDNTNLLDSLSV